MANQEVRDRLEDLIRESGEGYAAVSRLLGRNPAYIQQFIKRGIPRRLAETDRRLIACHFGVSETLLGAPEAPAPALPPAVLGPASTPQAAHLALPFLGAPGRPAAHLAVDSRFLQRHAMDRIPSLAAHLVESDAMAPTLVAGDHVLIDTADTSSPRDGLYLIESNGALMVKRLSVNPVTRRIAILSDNASYPSFPDCDPAAIQLVGRLFWVGRQLP
jgi:hypothetical protein